MSINWHDYFIVSEDSPTGLRWKYNIYDSKGRLTKIKAGMVAGGSSGKADKRLNVMLHGKTYKCARIIKEMIDGASLEGLVVDHLDGDAFNNAASNLLIKTHTGNMRNVKMHSRNSSGICGVSFWVNCCGVTYVKAQWRSLDGTNMAKAFSTKALGLLPAFNTACEYRKRMIEQLNAQGAGYTQRHGVDNNE